MKIKNIEELKSGDILIITSLSNMKGLDYNIGDRLIFENLTKLSPLSSSTIILMREKTNERVALTAGFARNLTHIIDFRNGIIDNLLDNES